MRSPRRRYGFQLGVFWNTSRYCAFIRRGAQGAYESAPSVKERSNCYRALNANYAEFNEGCRREIRRNT